MQQVGEHGDKFYELHKDIGSITWYHHKGTAIMQQLESNIKALEERISDLEHGTATSRPAGARDTPSIDARIDKRLDEIRRTDKDDPNFTTIDRLFFDHFGIHWRYLENDKRQMPDEVYGAYYLRAKAAARIAQDRIADDLIIRLAEKITGIWLITRDRYPADDMREEFAALFRAFCASEDDSEPSQQSPGQPSPSWPIRPSQQSSVQPSPRTPTRQLGPSAIE